MNATEDDEDAKMGETLSAADLLAIVRYNFSVWCYRADPTASAPHLASKWYDIDVGNPFTSASDELVTRRLSGGLKQPRMRVHGTRILEKGKSDRAARRNSAMIELDRQRSQESRGTVRRAATRVNGSTIDLRTKGAGTSF